MLRSSPWDNDMNWVFVLFCGLESATTPRIYLGACMTNIATTSINLNDLNDAGLNIYSIAKQNIPATNKPSDSSNYGIVVVFGTNDRGCAVQLYVDTTLNKTYHFYIRFAGVNGWRDWVTIG